MSVAKIDNYRPVSVPALITRLEAFCMEKVLEEIIVEGVPFTVLEKPETYYAGFHITAPDMETEPDVMNTYGRFAECHMAIADSITEGMLCFSIGYRQWRQTPCLREFMHGKETTNPHQPEGITVRKAPPSLFIRVQATDAAWALTKKLTGEDNPQWHMAPLFHLIDTVICNGTYGFEPGSPGNHETELYNFDGTRYAMVPVTRK